MIRHTLLLFLLSALIATGADLIELGKLSAASTAAEASKDYPTAIRHIESYAKSGGEPFYAALRLGWLHYLNGSYADAQRHYSKAASLQPSSINAKLGVLNTAVANKNARLTHVAATALLKLDPINYQGLSALADLSLARRDYREADTGYARILNYYPDDPDALSGAAWSALRNGDKTTAHERFRLLLGRNPAYPDAQNGFQQSSQ